MLNSISQSWNIQSKTRNKFLSPHIYVNCISFLQARHITGRFQCFAQTDRSLWSGRSSKLEDKLDNVHDDKCVTTITNSSVNITIKWKCIRGPYDSLWLNGDSHMTNFLMDCDGKRLLNTNRAHFSLKAITIVWKRRIMVFRNEEVFYVDHNL